MTVRSRLDIRTKQRGPAMIVTPAGTLDVSTAPQLRNSLLKCIADQPNAVIVDLARLDLVSSYTLSIFAVVARRSAEWSGTPLVLVAGPAVEARLGIHARAIARFLAVRPTLDAALAAIQQPPLRRLTRLRLNSNPHSAATARRAVAATCELWACANIAPDAMSVASELITNAIVHSGTDCELRLELRRNLLTVAVTDGSRRQPVLGRPVDDELRVGGFGLVIVDALTHAWGHTPTSNGGKIVWAVLRTANGSRQ